MKTNEKENFKVRKKTKHLMLTLREPNFMIPSEARIYRSNRAGIFTHVSCWLIKIVGIKIRKDIDLNKKRIP